MKISTHIYDFENSVTSTKDKNTQIFQIMLSCKCSRLGCMVSWANSSSQQHPCLWQEGRNLKVFFNPNHSIIPWQRQELHTNGKISLFQCLFEPKITGYSELKGSLNPTLQWMAHMGIKPMTLMLLALFASQWR